MSITNASNLKDHLFEYLEQTAKNNQTLRVSTKKGNIVIMSEKNYNDFIETFNILKYKGTIRDINEGIANIKNKDFWIDESEVDFENL